MSDLISRQAAIDALEKVAELFPWRVPGNRDTYDRYNEAWNDAIGRAEIEVEELPSAEKPFKLPKIYVAEGFDTVEDEDGNVGFGVYVPGKNQIYVAGDVEDEIRARALLHEVCHWVQDMCGRPFDEDEANEFSDIVYDALPSAQPEQHEGQWIDAVIPNDNGGLPVQVCDQCNTFFPLAYTGGGHRFCPNCGADMRGEEDETD